MIKVINKERGKGKTVQLLYLSDFHQWPIITFDKEHCRVLISTAHTLGLSIPQPISISEIKSGNIHGYDGYLMDEAIYCFEQLFNNLLGKDKLKAITMTESFNEPKTVDKCEAVFSIS